MIDSFPDIRQKTPHDCGPACVVGILRHFGRKSSLDTISLRLFTSPVYGTDVTSAEGLFRSEGLCVVSGEMAIDDIRFHTRLGRPVMCLIDDGGGHWVTILSVRYNMVYIQDPDDGPGKINVKQFLERWRDADRFGMLYHHFGIAVWE